MEVAEIQPWLFRLEPLDGESLSHFLGRFRGANHLTPSALGQLAEIGAVVVRWEKFWFNPPPSDRELQALARVVQVDAACLAQMLPPSGEAMKMEPIRLCGACYAELPCHKIVWQLKRTDRCDRHQLRLLSQCPNCKARFKIPALWIEGRCQRCFTSFAAMKATQKPV